MKKFIDLRSDTCTLPTEEMRKVIYRAEVGDYQYGEDIATQELEEYCTSYFGKEAAIFMPTGTMSDQVALRSWTEAGDEVMTDESYHINFYQAVCSADLAKISFNRCKTVDGIVTVDNIEEMFNNRRRGDFFGKPKLLFLENTINGFGGKIFPIETLKNVYEFCNQNNIHVHIDGERFLNACVASGISAKEYAKYTDSINQSFSKGLGAPFGSILLGTKSFIDIAKVYRKWYGGHLHQSGFMAAAALYAIKNNVERLKIDHENAKILASLINLEHKKIVKNSVDTNIILLDVKELNILNSEVFVNECGKENVLLYPYEKYVVRVATSMNVNEEDIRKAAKIINKVITKYQS